MNDDLKSSLITPLSKSNFNAEERNNRTKSVQWADWELQNVMEFGSQKTCVDDSAQTEDQVCSVNRSLPLIDDLVQTSLEIGSIASTSRTSSFISDTDEQQAALTDLITHLEDTAALLRDYILPSKPEIELNDTSREQTNFLLRFQVVLVFFTQLLTILLLTLFDHLTEGSKDEGYEILSKLCGAILQLLNMLLVLFATVVLSRQMLKYKVEGSFMAQTYIATVITFAGLYFIIYRIQPSSWEFASSDKMEENSAAGQFIRMLYLSVSAATLCGAANIQPRAWHVTLLLCFQSLVNFVYFASILAQTIGNYHSYTVQVRRSSSMTRATKVK